MILPQVQSLIKNYQVSEDMWIDNELPNWEKSYLVYKAELKTWLSALELHIQELKVIQDNIVYVENELTHYLIDQSTKNYQETIAAIKGALGQ